MNFQIVIIAVVILAALGALFGLVQGCIILFVAAWLLQFFGQMLPRELVEQTVLLKFFMTTTPFSLLG